MAPLGLRAYVEHFHGALVESVMPAVVGGQGPRLLATKTPLSREASITSSVA